MEKETTLHLTTDNRSLFQRHENQVDFKIKFQLESNLSFIYFHCLLDEISLLRLGRIAAKFPAQIGGGGRGRGILGEITSLKKQR